MVLKFLPRPVERSSGGFSMSKFITFRIRNETYGFPIEVVKEINRLPHLTPLPSSPAFIKGVMNLRGKIVPVADLRMKFGMEPVEKTRESCVIIIESQFGFMGLVVDAVREVREIAPEHIDPPIQLQPGENLIQGFAKTKDEVIVLIDVLKAFSENLIAEVTNLSQEVETHKEAA